MSRIRVFPGRPGYKEPARHTTVLIPFTELRPSMLSGGALVLDGCRELLDRLTEPERDVILANLLAIYGNVEDNA